MSPPSSSPVPLLLALLLLAAPAVQAQPSADCAPAERAYARGQELFAAGQHLLAAVHFSQGALFACTPEAADQLRYAYALSMHRLGEPSEVLSTTRLLVSTGTPAAARRARLLEALAEPALARVQAPEDRARLALWQLRLQPAPFARELQAAAPLLGPQAPQLRELAHALHTRPTRSALAAGLLSGVVPGLGQAYVGAWQSAAVALLLNALFLGATLDLLRRDLPFAAGAAGLVFSVTYVGNIVNAVEAAGLHDRAQRRDAEEALERALLPELQP